MNARAAIKQSIDYDTIAWADDTPEDHDYLLSECDEWTDCNGVLEFWTDEWRVHIRVG